MEISGEMVQYRVVMFVLLISLALLGATGATVDETCVSLDDTIEPLLLEPFRKTTVNSSSDFISFGEWKIGHFGFHVTWEKGNVGNFSTVQLASNIGRSSAQVCTTGNVRQLTANIIVGFDQLEAHFGNFVFFIPFFKTESAWATFTSKGSSAVLTLSAAQDITTQQCTVSLDDLKLNSWGDVEVTLRGNAGRNLLAEMLFNAKRAEIVKFLSSVGIGDKINTFALNRLAAALENRSDIVCTMITNN